MSTYDPRPRMPCRHRGGGRLKRAAQRLNVTQSAVSQRLRARWRRRWARCSSCAAARSATSAGRLLLKHTKQMRLLRADLERDLQELAPSAKGLARRRAHFHRHQCRQHLPPGPWARCTTWCASACRFEIITDDQDFTQEWLRSGQVLGCVTTLKQALRGCKMVPLGAMHYVAVASADFARSTCPRG